MDKLKIMILITVCSSYPVVTFSKSQEINNEPNQLNSTSTQMPPKVEKTKVIIIGTIHSAHYNNTKYSPEKLREIILSLKPDVILNELPLNLVDPNGRPTENVRAKGGNPECWAADTVAMELGIKQIPFDRPDRQENFKKTNYFERQKKAFEFAQEWGRQTQKNDPNRLDLKIMGLGEYASQSQGKFSDAATINSEAFDSTIRIKHFIWYEMMPQVLEKYKGYEEAADNFKFLGDEWKERNKIMADNIIKAAKQYTGKRLVVITGDEHRYILRDFLKNERFLDLKEYWEIVKSD
jgi:hypothetical protein